MEINSLAKLDAATKMLAEVRTVDDAKEIIDLAEAARVYARKVELGVEAENHAAEIKVRAQRRAGEILDAMEKNKGSAGTLDGRDSSSGYMLKPPEDDTPTYAEMNINKVDAHRWQSIAAASPEVFENYIEKTKEEEQRITTAGALRASRNNGLFSSNSNEWCTPQSIVQRVGMVLKQIDLDPCSNDKENPNVPALNHFTIEDDGLAHEWTGAVYMNPPYGREIADWVNKLAEEYEFGNVQEAIALVPSRTDTEWFRRLKVYPRCFIWGRLKFNDSDNSAPFPSMAVYFGEDLYKFMNAFEDTGDVYESI